MLCTEIVSDIRNNFCTQHVLPMFCKKKSFWQRFTFKENIQVETNNVDNDDIIPYKKALFDTEQAIENAMWLTTY